MSLAPPRFSSEDEEAQYYLGLLRSGTPDQRIMARARLASIFESRDMIEEATELLEGNVRAGIRERALYTKLASLYRRLGRDDDADTAIAEASMLAGSAPARPRPQQQPTRQQQPRPQQQQQPQYQQYAPPPPPQKRGGFSFGKFLLFGCFGIVGLGVLLVGLTIFGAGRMAQQEAAKPPAKVGEIAERDNWAVLLERIEALPELQTAGRLNKPQGVFVVATYTVTNKSNRTLPLNSHDFEIKTTDDKTTFRVASDAQIGLQGEPKAMIALENVQPGLSQRYRSVFDVNPSIRDYILVAAGNRFAVTLP